MTRSLLRIGVIAAVTALATAACERSDARLAGLTVGISKDSVLTVMEGPPQRDDPYLVKGQYIEALYFPPQGAAGAEATVDRNMTPVVLINSMLAGWGWAYWDSTAAANGIQVASKQ